MCSTRVWVCVTLAVEAMGAMALLPICDSSFACEDYNTFSAHPWSPFPLRRAHPGPGPHTRVGVFNARVGVANTRAGVLFGTIFNLRTNTAQNCEAVLGRARI